MNIPQAITDIEKRLKAADRTVEDFCAQIPVNRATWQRWKSGATVPRADVWDRVLAAVPPLPDADSLGDRPAREVA